ncbi:MAG: 16S rRNA (cytosine(1402)-N(4))-methyltransferase RsmH [Bacteroidales bacterium]|nr:16S rRNA (cytosine(1402)-N(4))-methyltransferase RsmH [Bacteroidales bacterium]
MIYHIPVLLHRSIEGLKIKPDGIYVDATFGGGGHSREILSHLKNGRLVAFDADIDAMANSLNDKKFKLLIQNFRFLSNNLRFHGVSGIDGLIADLGISSHQIDIPERGFSFRHDAMLDMRMNPGAKKSAIDILSEYSVEELSEIFRYYGEIRKAGQLAGRINEFRKTKKIERVFDLVNLAKPLTGREGENKFMAKVFQALRIEVNNEMENLKQMLKQTVDVMDTGARLVVITYHSLEDRLVKNFIRAGNFTGSIEKDIYGNFKVPFKQINRKVITPDENEILKNKRARSAKLRIAERI